MIKSFAYIQHHGLPSEKAHSVYIIKVAEASSNITPNTYLLHAAFNKGTRNEIRKYYDLQEKYLNLHEVKSVDIREWQWLPQRIKDHGWFIVSAWSFAFKSYQWLKNNSIDIVQTGDREIIALCKIFGKPNNCKIIYDVHFDFSNTLYDKFMEKFILKTVDLFVVNCEYLRKKFNNQGIINKKIIVLPNGYDPNSFNRLSKLESRTKYNFPEDKFIVGYIGRFETRGIEKGVDELIRAAAKVKRHLPIFIVAIGGPISLVKKYVKLAAELGLEKDVIIKDYVSQHEVGDILASFDVGALLYPPQGYFIEKMSPMKAIEYQAAGLPILATDLPSIRTVLKDSATYIKDFSVNSISEALLNISNNAQNNKVDLKSKPLSWIDRQKIILENL